MQQERRSTYPFHRLPHVLLGVLERLDRPRGPLADLVLQLVAEVLGQVQQTAAGVVDEDDGTGAQRPLADGQGADDVVGDHAAGVADRVAVAEVESEGGVQVETGVHAGDHGDLQHRPGVHPRVDELGGVALVGIDETVDDRVVTVRR